MVVAYGILVSPQSQLDFGFFTSLGLGLGLGLGEQGLGLGFDKKSTICYVVAQICTILYSAGYTGEFRHEETCIVAIIS